MRLLCCMHFISMLSILAVRALLSLSWSMHCNPDAKGISPADIYGIDVKKFREDVQGLAISFPKHIRVSFVANLDNIILEDYSSDDIIDLAEE